MGRPSKLTDKTRSEIQARLLAGEKAAGLAREYKVSRSLISNLFSKQVPKLKSIADQVVKAESAFRALPLSEQLTVVSLVDQLRSVSEHLAGAASFGAMTAHKLSAMAHTQSDKLDDYDGARDLETLQGIAVLTKMANSSSEIGLNLLRANKEAVDTLNQRAAEGETPPTLSELYRRMGTDKKDAESPL